MLINRVIDLFKHCLQVQAEKFNIIQFQEIVVGPICFVQTELLLIQQICLGLTSKQK